jgi:plasmid stability protein
MVDILIRNVKDETANRLKAKAKAKGASVSETALEIIEVAVKPSKAEVWAELDRLRARIGKVSGDSTKDIREDRDNDERYR